MVSELVNGELVDVNPEDEDPPDAEAVDEDQPIDEDQPEDEELEDVVALISVAVSTLLLEQTYM